MIKKKPKNKTLKDSINLIQVQNSHQLQIKTMLHSSKVQTSHFDPLQLLSFSQHTLSRTPTSTATPRPTTTQLGDRSSSQFERSQPLIYLQTDQNKGVRQTLEYRQGFVSKKTNNGRNSEQIYQSSSRMRVDREPLKTRDIDQKWLNQTMGDPKPLKAKMAFSKIIKKSMEDNEPTVNKIIQKLTEKQKLLEQLKKIAKIQLPTRLKNISKDVNKLCSLQEPQNEDQTMSKISVDCSTLTDSSLKSYFGRPLATSRKEDILKVSGSEYKKTPSSSHLFLTPKSNKKSYEKPQKINYSSSRSYLVSSPQEVKSDKLSKFIKKDSVTATELLTRSRKEFGKKPTLSDFKLLKKLGEGKFGTVFTALHIDSGSLFALKKISKSVIKSHMMIDQLAVEIKIQSFCSHKNIIRLYDCFDDQESLYLILEYMQDGTLFEFLKKTKTLPEREAAEKIKEVTQAVKYLHDHGIAHRDIKPQNIVIDNGVGKLCDFGWAAICNERRRTYCGTFDYAAPQILEGSEYDMSVDLWCIGVLAYELLVGKAPFYHISRKETMKKIMNVDSDQLQFPEKISSQAVSFIQNLLKKQPEERMTADALLRHPYLAQLKTQ